VIKSLQIKITIAVPTDWAKVKKVFRVLN